MIGCSSLPIHEHYSERVDDQIWMETYSYIYIIKVWIHYKEMKAQIMIQVGSGLVHKVRYQFLP